MFKGFDQDGTEVYDTKEAVIERAKMLVKWDPDPNAKVMLHRKRIPLWLAHLVQGTFLEWIGYEELRDV